RVELARILFGGTDVLLLDEPTNHLDNDAKGWLMGFLASYRGALLVVSHDVALLDKALTRVLHLDEGRLVQYRGTYTQYRTARALDEARRARLAERQQSEIRRLRSLADKMRGQTVKRARTAHALESRAQSGRAHGLSPDTPPSRRALPRVRHRDEGRLVQYRGTCTQYRTARAIDGARRARLAERQQSKIRRLRTLADKMRGETVKGARTAHALESRV